MKFLLIGNYFAKNVDYYWRIKSFYESLIYVDFLPYILRSESSYLSNVFFAIWKRNLLIKQSEQMALSHRAKILNMLMNDRLSWINDMFTHLWVLEVSLDSEGCKFEGWKRNRISLATTSLNMITVRIPTAIALNHKLK